ncbi:transposase [Glutamicibacter sp.]|uniref:transposase n=1 Tax=Glutamicibacter sp. TaxID=1931995 RepID=UPI003D6C0D49
MPKKYTDDVKKRAVELVLLAQSNPDTSYGAITRIAAQFDVKADTLRTWLRLHESTGQRTAAESVDLVAENRRLRAEMAESQRVNEILKKASAFFAAELDRK